MTDDAAPLELRVLLHADDSPAREAAWEQLITRHTRLLMGVARSFGGGHDEAVERYACILEKLRERDFHRLRAFQEGGPARFSTWLTVLARRLCLDFHRARYGRVNPSRQSTVADPLRTIRRRLADDQYADLDTDFLEDGATVPADEQAARSERDRLLREALDRLPPRDRLLLTLRFEDGLSAARIGGVLGFPTPFHVYRRLTLVLGQLRAALQARGVEDSHG